MRMLKEGGHRLFENDPETAKVVGEMLSDLEEHGMDAVRKYSRQFDDWDPPDFQLSEEQIDEAIGKLDKQILQDTDFCQDNVRKFAVAQLQTLRPLEVETLPSVVLGHKLIPVHSVGSYMVHPAEAYLRRWKVRRGASTGASSLFQPAASKPCTTRVKPAI